MGSFLPSSFSLVVILTIGLGPKGSTQMICSPSVSLSTASRRTWSVSPVSLQPSPTKLCFLIRQRAPLLGIFFPSSAMELSRRRPEIYQRTPVQLNKASRDGQDIERSHCSCLFSGTWLALSSAPSRSHLYHPSAGGPGPRSFHPPLCLCSTFPTIRFAVCHQVLLFLC